MISDLNPEAPEFYPHLTTLTQGGYTTVYKSVKSSNVFPAGASFEIFKTFTDFNSVTAHFRDLVVEQSNGIISSELSTVTLKHDDSELNTERVRDANDSLLDRVVINIDNVQGVNVPSEQFAQGITRTAWTSKPVITTLQVGTTMFIGAKNIPRPQLLFKDTIDNSESLWVPKISDKPNNIKPLALNILFDKQGEAVGYEHPYQVELEMYQPPEYFIAPDASPPIFPPPLGDTKFTFINTEAKINTLVEYLYNFDEIAVDLEHHSYRTYQGITCLIQMSTVEEDFIIDALAVREHVHKLNQHFTDPNKLKVFHGALCDIEWLQRDFGVYVVGMFDTYQAAQALNLPQKSLKSLLCIYCEVDANKKYQLADWRMRPLPDELIEYARTDTHYLIYIWRRMKGELLDVGEHLLRSVFDNSRVICGRTYNKKVINDFSHLSLYNKSKKSFDARQMAALRLLYRWRDSQARLLDESSNYLISNHMLIALAETLPRDVQGVNACCNPMPPFIKQNLYTLHRMILSCRELPLESQLYQMQNAIMMPKERIFGYKVHDTLYFPVYGEDDYEYFDQEHYEMTEENEEKEKEVKMLLTADTDKLLQNSKLNVFAPPYERYRKYRTFAQAEEIKEFKDKEAKIAAISKGNELIKSEVLLKLQQAKTLIENEAGSATKVGKETTQDTKSTQRNRNMSKKKINNKNDDKIVKNTTDSNVSPFNYKRGSYNKFRNDTDTHKITKNKKNK